MKKNLGRCIRCDAFGVLYKYIRFDSQIFDRCGGLQVGFTRYRAWLSLAVNKVGGLENVAGYLLFQFGMLWF